MLRVLLFDWLAFPPEESASFVKQCEKYDDKRFVPTYWILDDDMFLEEEHLLHLGEFFGRGTQDPRQREQSGTHIRGAVPRGKIPGLLARAWLFSCSNSRPGDLGTS